MKFFDRRRKYGMPKFAAVILGLILFAYWLSPKKEKTERETKVAEKETKSSNAIDITREKGPTPLVTFFGDRTVHHLALLYGQKQVALAYANNLSIFDIRTGQLILELKQHQESITHLVSSPKEPILFSSDVEGKAFVWNQQEQTPIASFSNIKRAEFDSDGFLLLTFLDGSLHRFNGKTKKELRLKDEKSKKTSQSLSIADKPNVYSPREEVLDTCGPYFASVYSTGQFRQANSDHIKIYSSSSKELVIEMYGDLDHAMFAPNCHQVLLFKTDEYSIKLADTMTGDRIAEFTHRNQIRFASFADDGKLLLAAGNLGVSVWEIPAQKDK